MFQSERSLSHDQVGPSSNNKFIVSRLLWDSGYLPCHLWFEAGIQVVLASRFSKSTTRA